MTHTRRTLRLDPDAWDVTLDGSGLIQVDSGAQATAQNVANEARLFTDDAYFIQDRGAPHFYATLGQRAGANMTPLKTYIRRAALRVQDVKEVVSVTIYDVSGRELRGEVLFTTKGDAQHVAAYF